MPKQVPAIDDDIYEYVQSQAVPLEDDFNSALRRLLGLAIGDSDQEPQPSSGPSRQSSDGAIHSQRRRTNRDSKKRKRAPKGSLLASEAYELPILEALVEQGGRAPTSEIIERVGEKLNGQLADIDRETLKSGDVRWRNRAQFVRLALIRGGDMLDGSPRGMWEISDQGRQRVEEPSQ